MYRFLTTVRRSLETGNWYAALFVALCMPDICGSLEKPTEDSAKRYKDWFIRYLSGIYCASSVNPFLTPEDCYVLRCAILHQGTGDIDTQKRKTILDEFCFFAPDSQGLGPLRLGHCVRLTNVQINGREFTDALCLHVTDFCEHMCKAVEKWLSDVAGNLDIQARMKDLLTVY
jgi:hypothetical protein